LEASTSRRSRSIDPTRVFVSSHVASDILDIRTASASRPKEYRERHAALQDEAALAGKEQLLEEPSLDPLQQIGHERRLSCI
jgi:hypothetical protein